MTLTRTQVAQLNTFWIKFDMKFCNKCGTTQDIGNFYLRSNGKRVSHCNECIKSTVKKYTEENLEKVRERCREYDEANRDRRAESARRRYASDPDRFRAERAQWRKDNPEKAKKQDQRKRAGMRNPQKPWPETEIGYYTAHNRIKAVFGSASNYLCGGLCGRQASQWSYNHQDPNSQSQLLVDNRTGITREVRFSSNPNFYIAMCISCHISLDRRKAIQKGEVTEPWHGQAASQA